MTLEDLARKRERVKRVNRLRGLPEDSPINIAMDTRYNSATIKGAYHAGQNASQVIAVEKQSGHSDIVGISIQNKLCALGTSMWRRGLDLSRSRELHCDTASWSTTVRIRSGNGYWETICRTKHWHKICSDRWGCSQCWGGERLVWLVHRVKLSIKRIQHTWSNHCFENTMKAKFSPRMFPGSTAVIRKEQRKLFSLDVKARCHRNHREILNMHAGDNRKVSALMPRAIETTLNCYGGDCTKCRYYSVVCGGGKKTNWWHTSMYLQTGQIHYLNMTDEDTNAGSKVRCSTLTPKLLWQRWL